MYCLWYGLVNVYMSIRVGMNISSFTSEVGGAPGGFASRVWDCTLFLAFASLLAHDNKTKSYYVLVGSWWLGSGVASDWACLHFWGRHLFCR